MIITLILFFPTVAFSVRAKKEGAYSAPTSMLVPSLNRNTLRQASAAFGHLLQRRGHSPRTDPGGDGRSLPAAPRRAQQRENGVTTGVTPFQRTY